MIGLPTSVGYGSAHGGETALNAMLCSCAAGLAVVGIDDGFGAGTIAARIARGGERAGSPISTASGVSPATCCSPRCSTRAPAEALLALPTRSVACQIVVARVERQGVGALHVRIESRRHRHATGAIRELLAAADLTAPVRARRSKCSAARRGGGRRPRVEPDDVQFHELGDADTLVDVCGASCSLEELGVERVVCSPLPFPRGLVARRTACCRSRRRRRSGCSWARRSSASRPTPSSSRRRAPRSPRRRRALRRAAAAHARERRLRRRHARLRRPPERRACAHRRRSCAPRAEVILIETNLDDLSPELVPDAVERCFAAGALDVWTRRSMKKGRPGIVLSALARPAGARGSHAMLEETSALGVRVARLDRYELERDERSVEVDGGRVRVKIGLLDGRSSTWRPSTTTAPRLPADGTPVKSVWAAALAGAEEP